jgi:hypothetical protein
MEEIWILKLLLYSVLLRTSRPTQYDRFLTLPLACVYTVIPFSHQENACILHSFQIYFWTFSYSFCKLACILKNTTSPAQRRRKLSTHRKGKLRFFSALNIKFLLIICWSNIYHNIPVLIQSFRRVSYSSNSDLIGVIKFWLPLR